MAKIEILKQRVIKDDTLELTVKFNYEKGVVIKTFGWPVTETREEINRQLEDCIYDQYEGLADPKEREKLVQDKKNKKFPDLDW